MSKNRAKKIASLYATVLKENNVPFSNIYLFGSYSKNKQDEWSDIDVMVVTKNLTNYVEYKQKLWRLTRKADTRIEPHACSLKDFENKLTPLAAIVKKSGLKVV